MSFLSRIKELGKDAAVYGLGDALGKFSALFTAPIITAVLSPADYGALALVQSSVGLLVVLASFNLNSGAFRYYYEYEGADRGRVLTTSLTWFSVVGVILAVALWHAAPLLERLLEIESRSRGVRLDAGYDYAAFLRVLAVGAFFALLDAEFRSVLRLVRRPWRYFALSATQIVLSVTLVIYLVVVKRWGVEGVLWAGVITSITTSVIGLPMVIRHYGGRPSRTMLGEFLAYSLPQFPSVLVNWALVQANLFFLNYYASEHDLGLYAIAAKVAGVALLGITAFRLAWDPFALSLLKEEDASETYAQVYSVAVTGFGLLAVAVSSAALPALIILTPAEYHAAASIVFLIVFARALMGANNVLGIGISISKRTKFISYAQVVAFVVNVGLNLLLTPRYSAWGAAAAFLAGTLAQGVATYWFAQRVHPLPFRFWRLTLCTLLLLGLCGAQAWALVGRGLGAGLAAGALGCAVALPIGWFVALGGDEREAVRRWWAARRAPEAA